MLRPTPATLKDYMQRRVLLALCCLAALAGTTLWIGWQSYASHAGESKLINLCGRQRLLTQRIAAAADGISEARDAEQVEFWRRMLLATHDEMAHAQTLLREAITGPQDTSRAGLRTLFFETPARLDQRAETFLDTALRLAQNAHGAPLLERSSAPETEQLLSEAFGPLMAGFEKATELFQAETEAAMRGLLTIQAAATCAALVLLGLLWNMVFRPMREGILELSLRLEELAVRDELTGLFNRRKLGEMLEHEIGLALRHGHALSLVIFDLDHFKHVNDACGHQAGDDVLRATARLAESQIRATDTLARWGGEEFCLVLPHTPLADALTVAEKVRLAFAATSFPCPQRITASFGVAEARRGDTPDRLAGRADAALYKAKEAGRNRVEQAD